MNLATFLTNLKTAAYLLFTGDKKRLSQRCLLSKIDIPQRGLFHIFKTEGIIRVINLPGAYNILRIHINVQILRVELVAAIIRLIPAKTTGVFIRRIHLFHPKHPFNLSRINPTGIPATGTCPCVLFLNNPLSMGTIRAQPPQFRF